jgi:hypothetical protein
MENIFGLNNTWLDYLGVIGLYLLLFICIRAAWPKIELNWRTNFKVLFVFWFIAMFTGNYLFYLLGVMSFLPWLNNFIHTLIWIGICLTWMYSGIRKNNMIEQFILFAGYSFIVKMGESMILGSWMKDPFYFLSGKYAYLIAMSIVDGFYAIISPIVLKVSKKFVAGVYIE